MTVPTTPVTTDELRESYTRAGLWRIGMTFERACASYPIRWSMEKSALARRHHDRRPVQERLI